MVYRRAREQDRKNPHLGLITEFAVPTASSIPEVITVGPDCNLWFTEIRCGGRCGKAIPGVLPVTTTLTGNLTDDGLPFGATLTATGSDYRTRSCFIRQSGC